MKTIPLILVFIITGLLVSGCKWDEPTAPHIPSDDDAVAEEIIGPEGGTLETNDFSLIIPPGALSSSIALSLYIEKDDQSFSRNRVSDTFRIEGFTVGWSEPLTMKIKYRGVLEHESYITMGFKHYVEEREDSTLFYDLVAAVDTLGFLMCTIPALQSTNSSDKLYVPGDGISVRFVFDYWIVHLITKMATYKSEFAEIKYDAKYPEAKIAQFAKDIDDAVYLSHVMGIINANLFQNHKIKVFILDDSRQSFSPVFVEPKIELVPFLPPELHIQNMISQYKINISEKFYENASGNRLRMVAGEGVFRFVIYCLFGNEKNWLHWASIYWAKDFFYGGFPDFQELVINYSLFMQPFQGMDAGQNQFPEWVPYIYKKEGHGLGMSSLLKYLLDNHNDNLDLLAKIFFELLHPYSTKNPVDAILKIVELPVNIWLPDFFKEYLSGTIWNIPAEEFVKQIHSLDEIHFIDEQDRVKQFNRTYPDLSARLCKVNLSTYLSEYVLGDQDELRFTLSTENQERDDATILVFTYKDGQLTYLNQGRDITIVKLKDLIDRGYTTLIAAVVNSASKYPYEGSYTIDLNIKIVGERLWPWRYVTIRARLGPVVYTSSSGDQSIQVSYTFQISDRFVDISDDGTQFSSHWIDEKAWYKHEEKISITMNHDTYEIIDFFAWHTHVGISENTVTQSTLSHIRGGDKINIPMVYKDDDTLIHQVKGTNVCSVIDELNYVWSHYPDSENELTYRITSWACNEEADILFWWARKKDDQD